MFSSQIVKWNLIVDGAPIQTPHSKLLPVLFDGKPAMLKHLNEDEKLSAGVLKWWNGFGAALIFDQDEKTIIMERATGNRSIMRMSQTNQDDDACRIFCEVAKKLHSARTTKQPLLTVLSERFEILLRVANEHGGILKKCSELATYLLASPQDQTILHGDFHHGNVLDFGKRGWLAIDPKGLLGERGFDFANIFNNPDLAEPDTPVALKGECFAKRIELMSALAGLERQRLLMWVIAFAGLSASWYLRDRNSMASTPLQVAEQGIALLEN